MPELFEFDEDQVTRLASLLNAYEAGRLNTAENNGSPFQGSPLYTRLALTTSDVPAMTVSGGPTYTPGSGTAAIQILNAGPSISAADTPPDGDETVYNISLTTDIPEGTYVVIVRDPFNGLNIAIPPIVVPFPVTPTIYLVNYVNFPGAMPANGNIDFDGFGGEYLVAAETGTYCVTAQVDIHMDPFARANYYTASLCVNDTTFFATNYIPFAAPMPVTFGVGADRICFQVTGFVLCNAGDTISVRPQSDGGGIIQTLTTWMKAFMIR